MSEPMPEFTLLRPATLDEAVAGRARHAGSRILAGGTDLLVNMRRGLGETGTLIDVSAISELKRIEETSAGLRIGAGVTLARLAADGRIRRDYPAIAQAAEAVAGPAHRTLATVGGNLCLDTRCLYYNQSHWWRKANGFCLKFKGDTCHVAPQGKRCRAAFSGDLAPALLVHAAEVEVAGAKGTRSIPLADLYRDDGAAHLTLGPGEMLAAVTLAPPAGWRSAYAKSRVRDSIDFPLAGVAVAMHEGTGGALVRIAITGTDSRPLLLDGLDAPLTLPLEEAALVRIDKLVQKQVTPMRTTTAASHYRRLAAAALAKRLTLQLARERMA